MKISGRKQNQENNVSKKRKKNLEKIISKRNDTQRNNAQQHIFVCFVKLRELISCNYFFQNILLLNKLSLVNTILIYNEIKRCNKMC